ncbi:MAG TPA: hypothetical protein VJJ20_02410 [Candidatus Paceibacterota bacterium]
MNLNLNWKLVVEIAGGIFFVLLLIWFFFFRQTPALEPTSTQPINSFDSQSTVTIPNATNAGGTKEGEGLSSPLSNQKIFKISDGPVAGAAFIQDLRPTTTLARFVMQASGHILDLAIDSPGSVARAVSNTTIPGIARVVWEVENINGHQVAAGAALQYLDGSTIKSVLVNFPVASTSSTSSGQGSGPVRIQFLPNDAFSIAASPDGKSIAYLLKTQSGSDGYVASASGTNPKKLFSLPLSQMILSWPSAGTLLATSKAATGVPGIALSINAASGAVSPLLYTPGLTANADFGFTKVVYQTVTQDSRVTFAHDTKSNLDRPLSFSPAPERCTWSRAQVSVMYCAVALIYIAPNYLDLWHQGTASMADSLVAYDLLSGQTTIIATPGGSDGGVSSDIAEIAVSADDKYLLFVKKGDRSLWGVRLY